MTLNLGSSCPHLPSFATMAWANTPGSNLILHALTVFLVQASCSLCEPYTRHIAVSCSPRASFDLCPPSFCSGVLCQAWLQQKLRTDQRPTTSRAAGDILLRKVPLLTGRQGPTYSPDTQRTKVDVTNDRLSSPSTGNPLSYSQRKTHFLGP